MTMTSPSAGDPAAVTRWAGDRRRPTKEVKPMARKDDKQKDKEKMDDKKRPPFKKK